MNTEKTPMQRILYIADSNTMGDDWSKSQVDQINKDMDEIAALARAALREEPERNGDAMAKALAAELTGTYGVLAHDGRGRNGEHYWVSNTDLAGHLKSFLAIPTAEAPDAGEGE